MMSTPFAVWHIPDQSRSKSSDECVWVRISIKPKAAASLYLTLPGIPYLYYGEEVGMLGQKPDENIRLPMQWSSEPKPGLHRRHALADTKFKLCPV